MNILKVCLIVRSLWKNQMPLKVEKLAACIEYRLPGATWNVLEWNPLRYCLRIGIFTICVPWVMFMNICFLKINCLFGM